MLDSIQIKNRLASRGFTDDQAEGLASEFTGLAESNLATKDDLQNLRKDIDAKLWRVALGIVGTNLAGTAALLALYGFAA